MKKINTEKFIKFLNDEIDYAKENLEMCVMSGCYSEAASQKTFKEAYENLIEFITMEDEAEIEDLGLDIWED